VVMIIIITSCTQHTNKRWEI